LLDFNNENTRIITADERKCNKRKFQGEWNRENTDTMKVNKIAATGVEIGPIAMCTSHIIDGIDIYL